MKYMLLGDEGRAVGTSRVQTVADERGTVPVRGRIRGLARHQALAAASQVSAVVGKAMLQGNTQLNHPAPRCQGHPYGRQRQGEDREPPPAWCLLPRQGPIRLPRPGPQGYPGR